MKPRSWSLFLAALALFALPLSAQFNLPSITRIEGTVEDAAGHPLPSALVKLFASNGSYLQSQQTNTGGEFVFTVNVTGPYRAEVVTAKETASLTINDGDTEDLLIRLRENAPPPRVDAAHSVVSLNDLEASGKAQSELAAAQRSLRKADFTHASSLVSSAIRDAPSWGRAYFFRGVLRFNRNDYPGARSDFAFALARNPKSAMALTEMAKLDTATGNIAESRAYLVRALQIPPVQWPTYLQMADDDLRLRNYQEALDMASLARKCQPAPPAQVHFVAGVAYYHLREFKLAQREFRSFLAQTPPSPALAKARAGAEGNLRILAKLIAAGSQPK